jgi:hypothetical protein
MFLEKIKKIGDDWGRSSEEMQDVACQSLLYGMRITRSPGDLKRELKKVKIDSTLAKPLWSGNSYLLLTLPLVLVDRKKKIPNLEDFLFAKKVLGRKNLKELRMKVKNLPKIPAQEILQLLLPSIKQQAGRGRFLPQFDSMHGKLKDIEQDLMKEAIEVMNKEMMNFKNTKDLDEIVKYLSYCLKRKTDTYLKQHTPKLLKARIDDEQSFDKLVETKRSEEIFDIATDDCEFRQDLRKVLSRNGYKAVSLLMNFADADVEQDFQMQLSALGFTRENIKMKKLKTLIEKYIGYEVFDAVKHSPKLKEYLAIR